MGHGRHEKHRHRPLLLHRLDPASGVEAGHVDATKSQLHRVVDEGEAGEGGHGTGVKPAPPTPARRNRWEHRGIHVADGHALGPPGRARGVEDVGQVIVAARHLHRTGLVVERGLPSHHSSLRGVPIGAVPAFEGSSGVDHQVQERRVTGHQLPVGHPGPGIAVRQHVLGFCRTQPDIERHRHSAGPMDGCVGDQPAQGVVHSDVQRHPIPGGDALGHKPAGQSVGLAVPVREGHGAAIDDRVGNLVRVGFGHLAKGLGEEHRRSLLRLRRRSSGPSDPTS